MQRLVKILSTMNLSSFLHPRRGVEISGNILESLCVGVCTMFEKKKYVEVNCGGTHT